MSRIVLFLLVVSVPAMATTPYAVLNETEPGPSTTPTPTMKDPGWLDPTGDPSYWNGLAFYAAYTEAWPSFNASFFNLIDLDYFGETAPVQVEQIEVGIMSKSGSDGVIDLIILPDDGGGYPDIANYYDVQENVADGWTSDTYPNVNWNNYTYATPVEVPDNEFWICFHTYWPSTFNFYVAMEYLPADGGGALYDAGMVYVEDGFDTIGGMGYASGGAFGLRCYVAEIPSAIESASLGEIKAVFK
jgi:hypothetical protein